jgi:phosphinothricin acetyltransferase
VATDSGYHSLIARIVSDNAGSIRLHEKVGYTLVGRELEVGRKHGRWLDVIEYQYVVSI